MRCRTTRQWMTITLADEAPPRARRALERHLEGCEGCRQERTAYAALDRALGLLPMESAVPGGLEQAVARRVRTVDAAPAARRVPWWLGVPALAGAAVLALAVRGTGLRTVGPSATGPGQDQMMIAVLPTVDPATDPHRVQRALRRRPPGGVPSEPPPDLTARPDLFVDLPMLRNLDRLEHFEAIQTTTLEGQDGERSNG